MFEVKIREREEVILKYSRLITSSIINFHFKPKFIFLNIRLETKPTTVKNKKKQNDTNSNEKQTVRVRVRIEKVYN
jgi:large-conductance mechanosensitive channel